MTHQARVWRAGLRWRLGLPAVGVMLLAGSVLPYSDSDSYGDDAAVRALGVALGLAMCLCPQWPKTQLEGNVLIDRWVLTRRVDLRDVVSVTLDHNGLNLELKDGSVFSPACAGEKSVLWFVLHRRTRADDLFDALTGAVQRARTS
jgi:hypothetical protein